MSGLRKHRMLVFSYTDTGTRGRVNSGYLPERSSDPDGAWWCSKGVPTGNERTVGMRPEHRVDAVFGCLAEVPMGVHYAIVCDGGTYLVRAMPPRDYGRDEIQVLAEQVVGLDLTAT